LKAYFDSGFLFKLYWPKAKLRRLMSLFGNSADMPGRARRRYALTPALSPGKRENFRALFESSMASVVSVALLPFRSEAAPTPGRGGFHKRRERLPLSWGRGPAFAEAATAGRPG